MWRRSGGPAWCRTNDDGSGSIGRYGRGQSSKAADGNEKKRDETQGPIPAESILDPEIYVIRIASIEKLIEMKRDITPQRDKDLYDINRLTALKGLIDEG
jgi:hypothetical protein